MALELRCLVAVFMHVFYSSCFCAICLSGGFQPCSHVPSTPALVLVEGWNQTGKCVCNRTLVCSVIHDYSFISSINHCFRHQYHVLNFFLAYSCCT